jgi:hypothetical protein
MFLKWHTFVRHPIDFGCHPTGLPAQASKRQERCIAVCAREGARAIIKRSVIKAAALALAALPYGSVAVSETEWVTDV